MLGKTTIVVLALASLMILTLAAPVMASQPKTTITIGLLQRPDPTILGTQFTTDDILHIRGRGLITTTFGSPWGSFTLHSISNSELNTTSYEGSGVSKNLSVGPIVLIEGTSSSKTNGVGLFTYHGPTFTATTNSGGTFTVTDGTKFSGLLITGLSIMHGTVNGVDVQLRDEYTGVLVAGFLTHDLAGAGICTGMLTYWFTG